MQQPSVRPLDDFFYSFNVTHETQKAAYEAVYRWVKSVSEGGTPGLVLYSRNYGVGKTHLARAAKAALDWMRRPVSFIREKEDFFGLLRESYEENPEPGRMSYSRMFRSWCNGAVILDDVGKEYIKTASWAESHYFSLFDGVCGKFGLLVTANLDPVQLAMRLGGAAVSRLQMVCDPETDTVDMSGLPDYRPTLRKAMR